MIISTLNPDALEQAGQDSHIFERYTLTMTEEVLRQALKISNMCMITHVVKNPLQNTFTLYVTKVNPNNPTPEGNEAAEPYSYMQLPLEYESSDTQ